MGQPQRARPRLLVALTAVALSSCDVTTAVKVPVATVEVSPPSATVDVGGSVQLTAAPFGAGGVPLKGRTFEWISSNSSVVTVDGAGLARAVGGGTATIRATSEGQSGEASLTVPEPIVTLQVSPASGLLQIGDTLLLSATPRDAQGNALTDRTVRWSSSDTAIATVTARGLVRGIDVSGSGQGRVTITATSEGRSGRASVTVHVDPKPIVLGDLESARISVAGEVDYYSFEANRGDLVVLTIAEAPSWGAGGDGARLTLFGPTGTQHSELGSNGRIAPVALDSGTHLIRVSASTSGATGGYNLGLEGVLPASPSPTALSLGDLASGTISAAGEVDHYAFEATAEDRVLLTLVATGGFSGSPAPLAWIYSPSGDLLLGQSFDADTQRAFTLSETGTYSVFVQASTLVDTGGYSLGLEGVSPLGPGATPIELGDLLTGSIMMAGEVDIFTFEATADDRVLLTLAETGGFASSVPDFLIHSPSGELVGAPSYHGHSQTAFTLTESGTHSIFVWANTLVHTGSYSLGLEGVSPPSPGVLPIELGDLLPGEISVAAEVDIFTFLAAAQDRVLVTLVETGGFPGARVPSFSIYSPSGVQVGGQTYDADTRTGLTLLETGTYSIFVQGNTVGHTGGYTLGLEGVSPLSPDAVGIGPGDLRTGELGVPGELDTYAFEAATEDRVELTLVQTGGFSASPPNFWIYSPSGAQVGGHSYPADTPTAFTLSETGTYSIFVQAENLVETGGYSLALESGS